MTEALQALLMKIRVVLAILADKFIAFVKRHAGFFSAALAAALLGLLLWFAIISKYADAVVELLKVVTAPALVGGGIVVWFVTQFKEEIRLLLLRLRKAGPVEFGGMSGEEVKQLSGGLMTGSIPPGASLGEIWEKAQAGSVREQFQLGLAFYFGKGVSQDSEEAVKWWRRAAEQGHAQAQYNLGVSYHEGKGVVQDDAEAAKWFHRAAEQGHAEAQYNLGVSYHNGVGVARDDAKAAKWFRHAAEQGYAGAQYNLGVLYYEGQGVPQDDAEVVKWYRLAAEQRHVEAQFNLGMAYHKGAGVAQDDAEAAKWFRRAAEQGHAEAKEALEILRKAGAAD